MIKRNFLILLFWVLLAFLLSVLPYFFGLWEIDVTIFLFLILLLIAIAAFLIDDISNKKRRGVKR